MENEIKTNEITLATLWRVFKKGILLMIVTAVVFGCVAALLVTFALKPTYSATASFWVKNATSTSDYVTTSLTGASVSIADNCIELASQDMPIRTAVRQYNLTEELGFESENECVRSIQKTVSASKKNSTSFMFYITVESSDPQKTYKIINALQYALPSALQELLWIGGTEIGEDGSEVKEKTLQLVGPVTSVNDVNEDKTSPIVAFVGAAFVSAVIVYVILLITAVCNNVIYDEKAINGNFSAPVIASVPAVGSSNQERRLLKQSKNRYTIRNYEKRLLAPDSPVDMREAFNTLKVNIIFRTAPDKTPVVALISGRSGEGNSFVSANLAISMASASKRVLLVETNMRTPIFSKILGTGEGAGLSELLSGIETETVNVIKRSEYGNFDVILCGKIPPNPTELLSSNRMRELVAEWRESYDAVILDLPPVCEFVDAAVVSSLVSGYLVTARCGFSNTSEISDTVSKIKAANGSVMGFVLNDVNMDNDGKLYGNA